MKKTIALLLLLPLALFGGLRYDKETDTWHAVNGSPDNPYNVPKNNLDLEKRTKDLRAARLAALSRTNRVTAVVRPGDTTVKGRRIFSKLKVVLALTEMGVWPQVKAWIESNNLYDLYLAAQVFSESDPHFKQGLKTLQTALKLTDEQIENILRNCIAQ